MEDGSLLVSIAGLAFVLLGMFQFAQNLIKSTDIKHKELFAEVEKSRRENLELRAKLAEQIRIRKQYEVYLDHCRKAYFSMKKENIRLRRAHPD